MPYTDFDSVLGEAVLDHLNAWEDKPCELSLEFPARAPIRYAMAMQPLSGSVYIRRYVDGSGICGWPFAVLVRFTNADDGKRLAAPGILMSLLAFLKTAPLPDLGEGRVANYFEMTAQPAVSARYEDGTMDYQAVYRLVYTERT